LLCQTSSQTPSQDERASSLNNGGVSRCFGACRPVYGRADWQSPSARHIEREDRRLAMAASKRDMCVELFDAISMNSTRCCYECRPVSVLRIFSNFDAFTQRTPFRWCSVSHNWHNASLPATTSGFDKGHARKQVCSHAQPDKQRFHVPRIRIVVFVNLLEDDCFP